MAQTTGATSFKDCKIECGADGAAWEDHSGWGNSIELGGGDRQIGVMYTYDGDTAIITGGKREPLEITVKAAYTEGASDFFEDVRAAYEAGSAWYLRWSPKGGDSAEFLFTSDEGIIKSFVYPVGEAGSGDPVQAGFTLTVPKITKSAVA